VLGLPLRTSHTNFTESFAELMAKKFFVCERRDTQLTLQKNAKFSYVRFFSFSGSSVWQRRLEFRQFSLAELSVQPCGPLFFKCFHTRPSTNFVISCAHKTGATSPCLLSNRVLLRFHDIASVRSLSSK